MSIRSVILGLLFIAVLQPLCAQQTGAAPVPAQISATKRVFISNLGGDNYNGYIFTRSREFSYNEFYAAMKSWSKFELVSAPADADLIVEIRQFIASADATVVRGDSVGPGYNAQISVSFVDPKTRTVLWSLLEHVEPALLKSNRDKNLQQAMGKIIEEVKGLIEPATVPAK